MNSQDRTSGRASGRFAYHGLERIFHERARLSILTSLVAHQDGLTFNDLKDCCQLTDGNLSRHMQMLQEAGLVEIQKGQRQNRPQTVCRMTDAGRERFLEYIACLENVVADALQGERAPESDGPVKGWSPA